MKSRIAGIGIVLSTVFGLCAASCASRSGDSYEASAVRAEKLSPASCPGRRWIGVVDPDAACPTADGFVVGRLIEAPDAPPALRRYCAYEWTGDPGATISLPHKPGATAEEWLDKDCAVVAPLSPASDVENITDDVLAAAHAKQIESSPAPAPGMTPVDVAVVDSWPGLATLGRSRHGVGVAGIIETIACSNMVFPGACPVTASPWLALDRYGSDVRDRIGGGTYGYQSVIAQAIYRAVSAKTNGKKIVNLSIGWDERYNASTMAPGRLSFAVAAVRDVLDEVACSSDTLVIAAAGNATGGRSPASGPMLPAAWESVSATCGGRSLVYAAGGVDGRDKPLPNVRPGARSTLSAPSFIVPSTKVVGAAIERNRFTGSSVSAAVVSATAALVWQVDPTLTPKQVVEKLATSGEDLGVKADFCRHAPCGNIKRISVCRALASAGLGVDCSTVAIGKESGVNPKYTTAMLTQIRNVPPLPHATASSTSLSLLPVRGCKTPIFSSALASTPRHACPSEALPNDVLSPAADPQPGSDPCPACTLSLNLSHISLILPVDDLLPATSQIAPQMLSLSFAGAVENYDIANATDSVTGQRLGDGVIAGAIYEVELPLPSTSLYVTSPSTFDGVTLDWTAPNTYKSSYPVIAE